MFSNYLKIAWRNLVKDKVFSVIIISGLCIGLSSCLLIYTYIQHELSYDNFHSKKERIARVIMEYSFGGNVNKGNYTSTKVGPSFKDHFPEVENFVRMSASTRIVKYGEKSFVEKRFVYADSTLLDVFDFKLAEGNKTTALNQPNSLLISESMSRKYFGNTSALGKTLLISSQAVPYTVSGVIADCPANSQIKYDFIASFSSLGQAQTETYWNANFITYLLVNDQSAIATLGAKIPVFMKSEMKDVFSGSDYLTYELEPLTSVHLYSEYSGFETNGNIDYVWMIGLIGLVALLIGCFSYINLSTAKSSERAKEIGIRKVSGAEKVQLFFQFMGESLVVVTLSCVISVGVAALALPYFGMLMDRQLDFSSLKNLSFVGFALLLIASVVLLGGAYPSFVLTGFQPVKVLKGVFKNTRSGLSLRKYLFVAQFAVSAFLIICSLVVQKQLHYIQTKNLGFDKEMVMVLQGDPVVASKLPVLKSELKAHAGVSFVSSAHFLPSSIQGGYNMQKEGMQEGFGFAVNAGGIDEEYLSATGIQLLAGENITKKDIEAAVAEDESKRFFHFVLNESAARQLGWSPKEAIGKKMFLDESRPGIVKGVVSDFHFTSIHHAIKPLVLFPDNYGIVILLKLSGKNQLASVEAVERTWNSLYHHRPFDYEFLNESYKAMYHTELQLGKAVGLFTLLAVFLSMLGLFGLSHYTILQRTKEISVRKVLGAPVLSIVSKLSSGFVVLVLIAVALAAPLGWLLMNYWLNKFSYHVEIGSTTIVVTLFLSILVCLVTVSFQSLRAALAKPITYLRNE